MENEEVRGSMALLAQGEAEELPCSPSCGYPGKEGADGTLDQVLASRGGGGGQGCPWAVRSHTWRIVHKITSTGCVCVWGNDSLVTHPGAQKGELSCSQSSPFGTLEITSVIPDLWSPDICAGDAVASSSETSVDGCITPSLP